MGKRRANPVTPRSHEERVRLFESNQNLAYAALNQWTAKNFGFIERYRLERDDLESVALTAVWMATETWEPKRGRFSTLATVAVYSKLAHILVGFTRQKNGAGEAQALSLDARLPGDETSLLLDRLKAPDEEGTEHQAGYRLAAPDLWAAVDALGERRAVYVRLHFAEELSQAQIGKRLGVSQMYASRTLRDALAELRDTRPDLEAVL